MSTAEFTPIKLFSRKSSRRIWKNVWLTTVHESELPAPLDFRTITIAREPIVIVRGSDNKVRAFLNVCPHRGNLIIRQPAGSLTVAEPSGNANRMTCMFHAWQFDCFGRCVEITRAKAGYQDRLKKEDVALTQFPCEVAHGGFVWLSLNANAGPLSEYIGDAFSIMKEELDTEPLTVFHYHKAVISSNYKLWHDTNSEFYHDYMHYFNRATSMLQKGYFDRQYTAFPNGHATVGSMEVKYDAYQGAADRVLSFPGMPHNGWKMVDLFPGATYNIRGSSLRVRHDDSAWTQPGHDRVPWSWPQTRYARGAGAAGSRSQHHLGTVRPELARGSSGNYRPRGQHAAGIGTAAHPAWPAREQHNSRRNRHATFLCRVVKADGAIAVQSVAWRAGRRRIVLLLRLVR